ncbi:MAG: SDR family oxidoreductase [Bacteroidia bacterium]|nr:SDR family oxidoreductase [Bacteroidia bacterium]
MKVLVIGASGRLGSHLVDYSLEKGHEVTAFARNIENYPITHDNLKLLRGDVLYPMLIESALGDHDIVLSVIGIRKYSGPITLLSRGINNIIQSMEKAQKQRLITITGAGILQETENRMIMQTLSFPPNLQNLSLDHKRVLDLLEESKLDWTIVCPSFMHKGELTGEYLTSADYYPKGAKNEVSVQDVADFITEEMVKNEYVGKRVGIAHPI